MACQVAARNVKCREQTLIQTKTGHHAALLGCYLGLPEAACGPQDSPLLGVWGLRLQLVHDLQVSGSSVAISKVTLVTVDSCSTPHTHLFPPVGTVISHLGDLQGS